jgi:hypothetical protein
VVEERRNAMSIDYRLDKNVSASELFGAKLGKFGVREHIASDTSERSRCLTDGRNYLWVYLTESGTVGAVTCFGASVPGKILNAVAEAFETDIYSEYEPQFWGFDTQEEWDAAMKEMSDRHQDEFYADVCAYVRGEPNGIRAGTVGEIQANIGRDLAEQDATILDDKERMLAAIDSIYERDHQVVVTLGPEDLALVRMLSTHEDDLPQA